MEWTERSFLLDIKPNGCFANLFVNCPEGDRRDLIHVLKDGVELAAKNNSEGSDNTFDQVIEPSAARESHRSIRATVDGLLLCPDTVTNYAWTDDGQTFSCKLKVERWEACYFSPRSMKATLTILTNETTLDQLCQDLDGNEVSLTCSMCSQSLLKDEAKISRFFQLPSSNFGETADDWFCSCSHRHEQYLDSGEDCSYSGRNSCTRPSSSTINMRSPSMEHCFIGDSNFLVNGNVVENTCVTSENGTSRVPILTCAGCRNQLGYIGVTNGGVASSSSGNTVRFYHSSVDLKRQNGNGPSSYLFTRFLTRERYFAWLLLSECDQQSSLKFAVKTLDNRPTLLVWLLDSYSIMVNGHLSGDWNAAPLKPFPILKMLYKKMDENDRSDPRMTGEDGSVGRLSLPAHVCDEMANILVKSTTSLPPACRAVGQFSVGYIRMATSL